MGAELVITPEAVSLELRGATSALGLKRRIELPRGAVHACAVDTLPPRLWRVAGLSEPVTGRDVGHFRARGEWLFLVWRRGRPAVRIDVDRLRAPGVRHRALYLSVDDAQAVVDALASPGSSARFRVG